MTFALIGDYQYRECMELNVSQIRRFYPKSEIIIGDLGGNLEWDDTVDMVVDLSGQTEREALMMMKPLFLISLLPDTVILMDGDTVLMQKIDFDYDTIVTTRKSKHGRINAGIVMTIDKWFAIEWLKNGIKRLAVANISKEVLCEQNALIDTVDSGKFNVKEVPCDIYNYSKVENGIPDDVRIVHLKSGRFKDPKMVGVVRCNIS